MTIIKPVDELNAKGIAKAKRDRLAERREAKRIARPDDAARHRQTSWKLKVSRAYRVDESISD